MSETYSFSIYGGYGDEVFGLSYYENQYYNAPQVTSGSGCNLPEFGYHSDWLQLVQTNYQVSYPVIPVIHGGTTYFYYPHVVDMPVYYYVPVYFTYQDLIGFEEPYVIQNNDMIKKINDDYVCNDQIKEYGSLNDMYSSFEQTLSEGILTYNLIYEEYPEKLNGASTDDDNESVTSDENDTDSIESDGNENIVVNQLDGQDYSVDSNLCEEDIDVNVIKKVSLMSLAEVQQDIDETYEYGKANLYNEALKGYTENKSTLEYLEWECHTLDDIPEEEEPETDSDEMDFDENVLKNNNLQEDLDKSKFPDVEDSSHFASDSLSEESPLASSQEAFVDNCEIMVKENQISTYSSVAEENDKSDSVLEHSLCEEKEYSGSMNANQEDHPPVDSPASEDKHKMNSVSDVCSSREEIHSGTVSGTEEVCPYMDSPVIEENDKMNSVQDLCLSKEKIDSVSLDNIEEPPVNVPSEDRGEEDPVILEPAASEKKQRKKRFSSLRKFFARMCCCVKKPS